MSKQDRDDDFWGMTDEFINLANKLCDSHKNGKVSNSILFSAARFNAFMFASISQDKEKFLQEKEMAIDFLTSQYKQVLTENLNDYEKNFKDYVKTTDA